MHRPNRVLLLLLCMIVACSQSREAIPEESSPEVHQTVAEWIEKMPVQDPAEQRWINEQLLDTGHAGIRVLAGMLNDPGIGDDTRARYALSSLAQHVSAPGADANRAGFESNVLDELDNFHSASAKAFLMEQLKLTGSDRSVPVLSRFLFNDRLYETAIDVLLTIRPEQATRVLRDALADAEGDRQRALIKALGELQDGGSVRIITGLASSDDWPTRRMALNALANIGSPSSNDVFSEVYDNAEPEHRDEIRTFYLDYAERLAKQGYQTQSAEISRRFLHGDYPGSVQRSALSTLFETEGRHLLDELIDLFVSSEPPLRTHAITLAGQLEDGEVTDAFVSLLEEAPESRKAGIITFLGGRDDYTVTEVLEPYMQHSNRQVRVAALSALYNLEGDAFLSEILYRLNESEDREEAKEIEIILLQMPSNKLIPAVAGLLPEANETAKPVMIRIIAHRRASDHLDLVIRQTGSSDKAVRMEVYQALPMIAELEDLSAVSGLFSPEQDKKERTAIQDAIVGIVNRSEEPDQRRENVLRAFNETSDEQIPYLLEILPALDIEETLPLVRQALDHSDPDIRGAAIGALAGWPDTAALPGLLEAVETADESERSELYNGYVRLVTRSDYPAEQKTVFFRDLLETAGSTDEEAVILGHISGADNLVVLRIAGSYFQSSDKALRECAIELASGVLLPSYEPGSEMMNISNSVLAVLDESTREAILSKMEHIKDTEAEDEITSADVATEEEEIMARATYGQLFNGRDLDGWEVIGDSPDSWGAEDGILYTDGVGSGWLSTTSVYDNFRLELEYRVPEEGNSGVFLRAPRQGNPAYEGMEIQILDDYADRYADLNSWQYTGSIYDVKGPSKRVTKPAGEWQHMIIEADGPAIRVWLNDELIVNANLINHMELADRHPGLVRRSGYIGLQNHSNRVEFRNIVIHEIE